VIEPIIICCLIRPPVRKSDSVLNFKKIRISLHIGIAGTHPALFFCPCIFVWFIRDIFRVAMGIMVILEMSPFKN
jgi:hypothetical protein